MDYHYSGSELEFFIDAPNWRRYIEDEISEFVDHESLVVDLGCGIGSNTATLKKLSDSYIGIEPDSNLLAIAQARFPSAVFMHGDSSLISHLESSIRTVCLFDVLEHIKGDQDEILKISSFLLPGSKIIILVPAHDILYSNFDKSVGHFRRYSRRRIFSILPTNLSLKKCVQMDSVGFVLSFFSKFLRFTNPISARSVKVWDSLIPLSRKLDRCFNYKLGKSFLVVFEVIRVDN